MAAPGDTSGAKLPAIAGLALLSAYFVTRALAPDTGAAEFAYAPWTPAFHPLGGMRGFTLEQLADHVLRAVVLGPALFLLALGLARATVRWHPAALLDKRLHVPAAVLSVATTAFVMVFVLRGRPIVDDEITYATMARIFASRRLADPDLPELFPTLFEIATPIGITGKYLPGEALVQVPGVRLGIPALLHVPLCALTLFAFYRAALLLTEDARIASWSTTFLALSPMFVLCAATGHSQATAFTCTTVAVLGYALAAKRSLARGGILAGLAVAFGMLVRPQAVPVVGVVLVVSFTHLLIKRRAIGAWLGFGLTSVLGVVAIVAYDYKLSGDTFQFPFWFMRATEPWGFGPIGGPGSYEHTLLGALANQVVVAVRLNAWWLGWPLSLLLLTRLSVLRRVWSTAGVLVGLAVALVLFQFGYYTTGVSDVGPIYHYELLLVLSVWAAYFVVDLSRERPRLAGALLLVHLVLGTGTFFVEQSSRLHRLIESIHAKSDRVLAKLPRRSLLLSETQCSEVTGSGWLLRGYPREVRHAKARYIIHPRPDPLQLDSLLARLPNRACFYVHNTGARWLEVLPCADARDLLIRPLGGGAPCLELPSTARRLGWYQALEPYF